jgi:hypothetical protein
VGRAAGAFRRRVPGKAEQVVALVVAEAKRAGERTQDLR